MLKLNILKFCVVLLLTWSSVPLHNTRREGEDEYIREEPGQERRIVSPDTTRSIRPVSG